MSEPLEFPPPPFTPAPLEPSERSGCRKALLFGCGGVFLILALCLVGMVVKAPEIMRAMLGYLEDDYTGKLAPNIPAADRERLHRAFQGARSDPTKLMQDRAALEAFQAQVMDLGAKPQLSREDVVGLAGVLERLSGTAAPPAPGPSAPVPAPSPSPPSDAAPAHSRAGGALPPTT
ncbi:MAG: hypothetical protein ABJC13_00490 [Acidobacteriota bacterium]